MKQALLALGMVWLITTDVSPVAGQPGPSSERPLVFAVFIHAGWDDASKAMDSIYDGLRKRFDEDRILFVRLDVTDSTERRQSKMLAAELDLNSVLGKLEDEVGTIHFILGLGERKVISALTQPTGFAHASAELDKALTSPAR